MKLFLKRLAARDELTSASSGPEPFGLELMAERLVEGGRVGGRRSFRDLAMGETAALSHSTLFMALSRIEGPVEGNAEGARIPCKQVGEKTSP
jgi:hypothetical protein